MDQDCLPRSRLRLPARRAKLRYTPIDKDGYIRGFNAQAAVDSTAQIIVAHGPTQSTSDHDQLVPLVDAIEQNLGRSILDEDLQLLILDVRYDLVLP